MKRLFRNTLHYVLPLLLGAFVFYWVYRDFDFREAWNAMLYEMDWGWMLFSLVFGILALACSVMNVVTISTLKDEYNVLTDTVDDVSYKAETAITRAADTKGYERR